MLHYDVKILLAFGETFNGNDNEEFFQWLLSNGYPELAALSKAIRGSEDAFNWLIKNGYVHYAALDSAIDDNVRAYQWLNLNQYFFLAILSDACHNQQEAIEWLTKKDLKIFILIAERIRYFRNSQTFDHHKIHF